MQLISTELKAMGIEVIPSEANFLTFRLEPDARGVYDALLRQGLIVRHLASFGLDDCIRVTIGTPEQNRRFLDGLKRALAGYSVSSDAAKWT
jgi:histidinol-phosphate aminotransferase